MQGEIAAPSARPTSPPPPTTTCGAGLSLVLQAQGPTEAAYYHWAAACWCYGRAFPVRGAPSLSLSLSHHTAAEAVGLCLVGCVVQTRAKPAVRTARRSSVTPQDAGTQNIQPGVNTRQVDLLNFGAN
jgi:hypothetical protein